MDGARLTPFQRWELTTRGKQRSAKVDQQDEFEGFIETAPNEMEADPLDYWQQEAVQRTYPRLHKLAINTLSALAMSAESERVFSGARRTISPFRASLSGRTDKHLSM